MSRRPLDVEIRRNGRREQRFAVKADPANPAELQDVLEQWLAGNKWHPGRWAEFDMLVRHAGEGKVRATIRAGGG
jgi:hypothetical protein